MSGELVGGDRTVSVAGALSSVSSPYGGLEQKKGFWFNVNAELIIYGATEPNATVTIGGTCVSGSQEAMYLNSCSIFTNTLTVARRSLPVDGDFKIMLLIPGVG